jgi:ATP-dependent Lon protease
MKIPNDVLAQPIPLLPLRSGIVLPGSVVTLPVGRRRSRALAEAVPVDGFVAVGIQKDSTINDPTLDDLHPVFVLARVRQKSERGDRGILLLVEGVARFRAVELVGREPYLRVRGELLDELRGSGEEASLLAAALREKLTTDHGATDRTFAQMLREAIDPGRLADRLAVWIDAPHELRVEILLETDVPSRLRRVMELVGKAKASAELRDAIDSEVRRELGKSQKEVVLREQLKAIKKQLGDETSDELSVLREKLEAAELPKEAREQVERELSRLESMGGNTPDAHIARKYLELVADLPWGKRAPASDELGAVEQVLADDHEGLEEPKRRILEHMAVLKLKGSARGTVLCLVGPPGVGKTSLAQSVARATGRPLARISLGGVRDEAEVRGHRRTYIGALPGRIIAAIRKAGVKNPVMVLDEVDKLGRGWQGDPAAALLEILDPEQNDSFTDHYLEIPFDLSEVLFIATANDISALSAPLRDRLEIIEIGGYTTAEKERIAARHLVPKQLERHGLPEDALALGEGVLDRIIREYTQEAGVRQLSREIAKLCRGVALAFARTLPANTTSDARPAPVRIEQDGLTKLLGRPRFFQEIAERSRPAGVAAGLAWTPVGGEVLYVETTRMRGKGKLEITGQLGEVMSESARAALAYLRSHADELGVDGSFLESTDLHIHVPAGAVPKDGPSAGVTMFTALASLLTGRRVRPDTVMTGEATLRGRVLPVGGIKSKVLAAHRAGFERVLLPKQNERDLDEIPESVRDELQIVFVEARRQVLREALEDLDVGDVGPRSSGDHDAPLAA